MADFEVETAWCAEDEDGIECVLDRIMKDGKLSWQLTMTKGPFSGYPTIDLDFNTLERFRTFLEDEIFVKDAYPPKSRVEERVWAGRSVVEPKED